MSIRYECGAVFVMNLAVPCGAVGALQASLRGIKTFFRHVACSKDFPPAPINLAVQLQSFRSIAARCSLNDREHERICFLSGIITQQLFQEMTWKTMQTTSGRCSNPISSSIVPSTNSPLPLRSDRMMTPITIPGCCASQHTCFGSF